ncbi:transcriptional repressor MprA [Sporotomaculum syntrophicum]|uniref:Transcriptional repressor MprA n=1 Tax=Sporotomaculum syntrophicum TaxID=182264 RepID=A0A9D2WQ38_9FIRM|nr:MarR family transcriptional regulator [Sporotomaculum syntrophicum]KAF1085055.1 transcriptional repressor MprA [Sporotomaculum syntrophicum]
MHKDFVHIYNLIQELSWHFGAHGINGECCGDLSLVEYMALKRINDAENITVQEVGHALNFTKSGASKIIDRLENKGYVKREISSIDGRVCCVNTTAKGAETALEIVQRYSNYVSEMLKAQDAAMVENVKTVLEILVDSAHRQENLLKGKFPQGGGGMSVFSMDK